MNCFKTLVIVVAFLLAFLIADLHGQTQPTVAKIPQAPAAKAQTDIAAPDAAGVFPSIRHKGDIVDFLKFLGVACNKNIVPSSNVRGQVSVNLFNVTAKEVMDVVLTSNGFAYEEKGAFIFVYTQKEYEAKLAAARKTVSRAFHLNYITAQDTEALIKPLLSETGQVTTTPATQKSQSGGSGETWAGNNYIVVVDYPEYVDAVEKLLDEIDRQPLQVLIEATILVAKLDDENSLGIDFNVLGGVDFNSTSGAFHPDSSATNVNLSGTSTSVSTGFTTNVGAGGLSIGIIKNNIGMFISALEGITDTVTLGNPKVLTLNRQTAKVKVGGEQGYVASTVSTTTAETSNVEMLETGTILEFTPFITDDGYIRMNLHPEDSIGAVVQKGTENLPEKTVTEVITNVLVKDGRSIVIGGLFRESTTLNRSQVPLAGNIPLIGNLFRSTNDRNIKEEIIFIITPHIVKESVDYAAAEEIMGTIDTLMIGAREGMQWHGRERLAGAHYNRARELEADGKLKAALWDANLAVHISPRFLDALDLRNELRAKHIYQGEYGCMHLFMNRLIEKNLSAAQPSVSLLDNSADFGLSPIPVTLSDEEADPVSQAESQTVDDPQIADDPQVLDEMPVVDSQVDEQQVVDSQVDDSQLDEPQVEEEQLEENMQLATEPTDEQF